MQIEKAAGNGSLFLRGDVKRMLKKFIPQPLTAIVMVLLAAAVLAAAWANPAPWALDGASLQRVVVALGLAAAVVVGGLYPIHIQFRKKVLLTTPPLYLAATLLPPGVAALTAGLGVLALQLVVRRRKGSLPSDIATASARWVVVAGLSAWVANWQVSGPGAVALPLLGAAAVMLAGDIVTGAFEVAPMSGEPPLYVMVAMLQGAGLIEAAQYLLGILGTLSARQQVWSLALLIVPTYIIYAAFKHTKEMYNGTRLLLESMADAVDLRDAYTGGHSRRVAEYSQGILQEMNVRGAEAELIYVAARVHDIGKIGVPDVILNKPGRLTPEEKRIMDSHPERGAELIARYSDFARGVEIVLHHHERWDGQGYPKGLKSVDIPFGARVIAVVDSYDAMTSNRPYRSALTSAQAVNILLDGRGRQWDPMLVDAFVRHIGGAQPAAARPEAVPLPQAVGAHA
jgi:HD-GYP domain-containing protein (c-di-GMP phosphodiesterase class II)